MFDSCSTLVFRELQIDSQTFYQWFREGNDHEERIVPLEHLYSEQEHWALYYQMFT